MFNWKKLKTIKILNQTCNFYNLNHETALESKKNKTNTLTSRVKIQENKQSK